jgi:colicin import membrane protein/protein TonB
MSPLETSALSRRDRLWPAVSASLVAHLLLVGWAVAGRPPAIIDLDQKPIVAKLVRLGEKRPEQYLPRKDEAPPAPAPPAPPAPAAPAPVPAAAPSPTATSPRTKPPAPAPAAPAAPARGASLAAILSKVQRQQADEARWGAPDGDRSGDSETAEGDQYLALVDRALRANYSAPVTIPERERLYLEATVVLWVEPDGRIIRWRQERPSGNATFDAAVERTLRGTARVPPPPESMRESLRKGGIQLVFRARDT